MLDPDMLAWAMREGCAILTFDKDFGALAFHAGLLASCSRVRFLIPVPQPHEAGHRTSDIVASRDHWAGLFAVVEPDRI